MAFSSVRTALWLAKRGHWSHLAGVVVEKLRRRPSQSNEAVAWCEHHAVAGSDAIVALIGSRDLPIMPDHYLQNAAQRLTNVNVRMGGAAKLDLLYAVTCRHRPLRMVETGVALGWSSLAILAAFRESGNKDAVLISVDMPYPKRDSERLVGAVVPDDLRRQWTLVRKPDRNGVIQAIEKAGGPIDIVHYDSDKSYGGRMFAYQRLWRALRPGGIFISDDISDNLAFADFFVSYAPLVIWHDNKYVGVVRKPE